MRSPPFAGLFWSRIEGTGACQQERGANAQGMLNARNFPMQSCQCLQFAPHLQGRSAPRCQAQQWFGQPVHRSMKPGASIPSLSPEMATGAKRWMRYADRVDGSASTSNLCVERGRSGVRPLFLFTAKFQTSTGVLPSTSLNSGASWRATRPQPSPGAIVSAGHAWPERNLAGNAKFVNVKKRFADVALPNWF